MLGITDLTTFIIGTTLIVLLPGPNSLYVMSIASRYGIKTGYLAAFGVFSGDLILIILTLYTTNFTEPLSYQDSAFLKLPKFP